MNIGNSPTHVNNRRIGAAKRLENSLRECSIKYPATFTEDEKRINAELRILVGRITTLEVARGTRTKKYKGVK